MRRDQYAAKLQSLLVVAALLVSGLAPAARAQLTPQPARSEPVFINFGQPNIWSLEQAHYLLARMRARSLGLKTADLNALDPNEVHGTRLDVLRAAGAGRVSLVCICVDDREAALKIVELFRSEFPDVRTYVRAYDRIHAIDLMKRDADFQLRETFESAVAFGKATLEALGVESREALAIAADVRRRDIARLMIQRKEGLMGGRDLMRPAKVEPEPLTAPRAPARPLSPETREIIADERVDG